MFIFEDVNRPEVIRRERLTKRIIIVVVIAAILGGFLYWEFRNWPEERTAKKFLATLQAGDYQQAYRIWQPAPTYAYKDFLRDWGPNSEVGNVKTFKIVKSHSSGSGVIVTALVNNKEEQLWVERKDKSLSFPPY